MKKLKKKFLLYWLLFAYSMKRKFAFKQQVRMSYLKKAVFHGEVRNNIEVMRQFKREKKIFALRVEQGVNEQGNPYSELYYVEDTFFTRFIGWRPEMEIKMFQ